MVAMVFTVMVMMMVIMTMVGIGTNALNMVVMALLWLADFVFSANDLYAILAQLAVHLGVTAADLLQTLYKGINDLVVGIKVGGIDDLNVWVSGRKFIGGIVNTLHQTPSEQKVREYDNAFKAQTFSPF
jgi:hypothetical protein